MNTFGWKGWALILLVTCLVFGAMLWGITKFSTFNLAGECANEVLQKIPSPDGRFVAIVFERNCGATTSFSTEVSVLPVGEELPDEGGNAFRYDGSSKVKVEWAGNRQLKIRADDLLESFYETRTVGDIQIVYVTN